MARTVLPTTGWRAMSGIDPQTIAVLGAGRIGGTLGRAFTRAGHTVAFGVREPSSAAPVAPPGDTGGRVASVAEALNGAEVVVLAVPGGSVEALVRKHAAALAGTLVIDAAN